MRVVGHQVRPGDTIRPGVRVIELEDKTGEHLSIAPPTTGQLVGFLRDVGDILMQPEKLFEYTETAAEPPQAPIPEAPRTPSDATPKAAETLLVRSPAQDDLYPMRVSRTIAASGDGLRAGDDVMILEDRQGRKLAILAPADGKLLALPRGDGDILLQQEILFQFRQAAYRPEPAHDRKTRPAPPKAAITTPEPAAESPTAQPDGLWQITPNKRMRPASFLALFSVAVFAPFLIAFMVLSDDVVRTLQGYSRQAFSVFTPSETTPAAKATGPTLKYRVADLAQDLDRIDNGRTPAPTERHRQEFNAWMDAN